MTASKPSMTIEGRAIGPDDPTYFIADISANHDGDLERAKELIFLAKEAGADAAKFQHFRAQTIVSDAGFRALGNQQSHQANWKKSVFDVYRDASLSLDWTPVLRETCNKAGITFFTSPYAIDLVDHVDPFVPAYKIGSGDITWLEIIQHIAAKRKPYILATGASSIADVQRAVDVAMSINPNFALLQCNTNYTGSLENFRYSQLNVITTFRTMYPELVVGLSDHTPGHATVLGAVALGARIIEKHFTDDASRIGPDHAFSMTPATWREMVLRSRELETALGGYVKRVEPNETQTAVLQRRSVRLREDLVAGTVIERSHLEMLRPCPPEAITPFEVDRVVGKRLRARKTAGSHLTWADIE